MTLEKERDTMPNNHPELQEEEDLVEEDDKISLGNVSELSDTSDIALNE